ncbi:CaiB/BaiF CoA transferase family protein [Acuticoccus sp.]|uniref:CaiB/BaiF CoA transferase family protein n=1 Tax=Acuticoccus sp. TaxID=1904378 RepID=UPI003B529931
MSAPLPRKDYEPDAPAPLDGVRILDLSRLVAGNMISSVLADLGADVVKVERPGRGDDLRGWTVKGVSTHWKVYARNKRSVVIDLRQEEGKAVLLRLVATAGVLIENYVPGTLEAMGLGPEVLHEANPKLVIVRVSGWGQTGPFRHKPGFGTLVEAMSGFASMNGYGDRPPVLPPLALADMIAGLYGSTAVLTALRHVEVSGGEGQVIDLSLLESIHSILGPEAAIYQLTGRPKPRTGSRSNTAAPRNIYRCRDGRYVAMSASMQSMAERLLRAIGRPDLVDDPKYRTNADRLAHNDELDAIIADYMAEHTQAENLAHFEAAGVTVGPVCDVAELGEHPYTAGREVLASWPDDEMEQLPMHTIVPRLSATPGRIRRPAPKLGEHTDELLAELGLSGDLARLRAEGVVG